MAMRFAMGAILSLVILWLVYRSMRNLAQRNERNERLRQSQKLQVIGGLTAGVAHDLNNNLTAVRGNIERASKRQERAKRSKR
jgi:signal transduction histidine kinase